MIGIDHCVLRKLFNIILPRYRNTTFTVYPNPANNFITIDSTLDGNYNLVSMLGKTVAKGTLRQGDNTIDLSNFKEGFAANIHSNNNSKTLKMIEVTAINFYKRKMAFQYGGLF